MRCFYCATHSLLTATVHSDSETRAEIPFPMNIQLGVEILSYILFKLSTDNIDTDHDTVESRESVVLSAARSLFHSLGGQAVMLASYGCHACKLVLGND